MATDAASKKKAKIELPPELYKHYEEERAAHLAHVDSLERLLGIPRTSDARRYAKNNGWLQGDNVTHTAGKQ